MKRKGPRKSLTTYEAADLIGVHFTTIKAWIEKGFLPAARTPGGHYRIPTKQFTSFCKSKGFGLPATYFSLDSMKEGGIFIGSRSFLNKVKSAQTVLEEFIAPVVFEDDVFKGLMTVAASRPEIVVVDSSLPTLKGIINAIEKCLSFDGMHMIVWGPVASQRSFEKRHIKVFPMKKFDEREFLNYACEPVMSWRSRSEEAAT